MPSLFSLRGVKDKRLEGMTLLMVLDSYSRCFRATHCQFARDTTSQVCLLMETNTLHEMGFTKSSIDKE